MKDEEMATEKLSNFSEVTLLIMADWEPNSGQVDPETAFLAIVLQSRADNCNFGTFGFFKGL